LKIIYPLQLGFSELKLDYFPETIECDDKIIYTRGAICEDLDNASNALFAEEYRNLLKNQKFLEWRNTLSQTTTEEE